MTEPRDDAPAFPFTAGQQVYATGLTKREWYAGQALAALDLRSVVEEFRAAPHDHETWQAMAASLSFQVADAMIAAAALPPPAQEDTP